MENVERLPALDPIKLDNTLLTLDLRLLISVSKQITLITHG